MKIATPRELSNPLRVVIAASLMLLVAIWALDAEEQRVSAPVKASAEEPDFYMSAVDSLEYDDHGRPKLRMKSEEMSHYPATDITDVAKPDIQMLGNHRRPWSITAHFGQILPGGDEVELHGRVRIKAVGDRQSAGELRTERLVVLMDREYAETSEAVTILTAQGKTTATGMQADLRTSRVKLLKRVRGTYDGKMFQR